MRVKNSEVWQGDVEANRAPYEASLLLYAESWADLMEKRMVPGARFEDVAREAMEQVNRESIFVPDSLQLASVVAALVKHWWYGEALKRWYAGQREATKQGGGE